MLVINNTKKTIHIPDWSEKEKSPPLDIAVVSIVVSRPTIEPTNINVYLLIEIMLVINNTKKTIHIPDWSEKEKPPPLEIAVVSIVVSRPTIEPTNINVYLLIEITLVINNTKKTIHIPDWSEKEKSPPLDIAAVSIVVSRPTIEPTNINMRKNININQ